MDPLVDAVAHQVVLDAVVVGGAGVGRTRDLHAVDVPLEFVGEEVVAGAAAQADAAPEAGHPAVAHLGPGRRVEEHAVERGIRAGAGDRVPVAIEDRTARDPQADARAWSEVPRKHDRTPDCVAADAIRAGGAVERPGGRCDRQKHAEGGKREGMGDGVSAGVHGDASVRGAGGGGRPASPWRLQSRADRVNPGFSRGAASGTIRPARPERPAGRGWPVGVRNAAMKVDG